LDRLYSPWRLKYVTAASGEPSGACIFCAALERDDALIVHRGVHTFVILNLFPYNNGHLMVVPNRHIGRLAAATDEELAELMRLTRTAEIAISSAYAPHGLNMGLNLGKSAGAGVLDHLHMHVVPRWEGDTNFMSVVGETRVLPEEIPTTATRLRAEFEKLTRGG
jgi:ATP adenylyltransferase